MSDKKLSPFLLPEDGWLHITPIGEFPHHVGVVQVIDRRACDLMADDFAKRRKEEGDRFAGLLVDYDHFSLDTEKPSEAAGWLTELEARDDGLWGRVRWTDAGLSAVTGGRYRFVSAVFPAVSELEWVDKAARKGRPVRLVSVALTNEPNIKGGKPIANRAVGEVEYEYGCAMLVFPSDVAEKFSELWKLIDGEDLAEGGLEKEPHVTIQYGFKDGVGEKQIRAALSLCHVDGFQVEFTEAGFFPDSGKGYDVVWIGVLKTALLQALREYVRGAGDYVDKFPVFNPHATVAYVKPGKGAEYAKAFHSALVGTRCEVGKLTFVDASGCRSEIPLVDSGLSNRGKPSLPGVAVGGGGAAKYMWLVGATKSGTHCPECAARHGKVKTLLEWMRMPAPYCKCACHLARVGVEVEEGYKPPAIAEPPKGAKDDDAIKNRIAEIGDKLWRSRSLGLANSWTDAAREVSLRVRQNKARIRELMKDKPDGWVIREESGTWVKRGDDVELVRVDGVYAAGQNNGRFITELAAGRRGDYFDPYALGTVNAMAHLGYITGNQANQMRAGLGYFGGGSAVAGSGMGYLSRGGGAAGSGYRNWSAGGFSLLHNRWSDAARAARKNFPGWSDAARAAAAASRKAKAGVGGSPVSEAEPSGDADGFAAAFIRKYEGFEENAYPDPATGGAPWTAGYGSTRDKDGNPFKPGDRVTREEAEGLLLRDMKGEVSGLASVVPWETLAARQQAALMSWAYNIGGKAASSSTLARRLAAGEDPAVVIREELPRWNKAGGRVMRGLDARRKAEVSLAEGAPIANRWSDAARVASAAARLAKYGAMMGFRPWGDSARAAALASRSGSPSKRKSPGQTTRKSSGKSSRKGAAVKMSDSEKALAKADAAASAAEARAFAPRRSGKPSGGKRGACYNCGAEGHWAKDCPNGKDEFRKKPAVAAPVAPSDKTRAAYERLSKLPARSGGYYPDGRPVIADYAGASAEWAKSPTVGKAGVWDAEPIARRQAAYEADMRALWDRSNRVAANIETFNSLVASVGGAVVTALGASSPAGAASATFGGTVGAPSGRPPVARRLDALERLMGREARARASGLGKDGLTEGERWGVRSAARDMAVKWWYSALRGTRGENTEPPRRTADLLRVLPEVTGNPMAAKWVVEAAYKEVRQRLPETRRVSANEQELRETYLNDLREAGEPVGGSENVVTPFLRLWRDRVVGRGAYGPTGTYKIGKVGEASVTYGRGENGAESPAQIRRRGIMESTIREWMPDIDVPPGTPYRILRKLYWTAIDRRRASGAAGDR